MSDFKVKMQQIRFPPGSAPEHAGGGYSTFPDPLAVFQGHTSKGREGKGMDRGEGTKDKSGGEGTGGGGRDLAHPKMLE